MLVLAMSGIGMSAAAAAEAECSVAERLATLDSGLVVQQVSPSPLPGLSEVQLESGEFVYVSEDCRYLLAGSLYELHDEDIVDLTGARRDAKRRDLLAAVPESQLLAFAPDGEVRATVMVFTDVDCGYCRMLHDNLPSYHALGIEVRYLAYPRAGVGSPAYDNMVSAWCADDPLGALTGLKRGEDIPEKSCINPVAEHYALGQQIELSGTPTIILPDGRMLTGLRGADELAELLGI